MLEEVNCGLPEDIIVYYTHLNLSSQHDVFKRMHMSILHLTMIWRQNCSGKKFLSLGMPKRNRTKPYWLAATTTVELNHLVEANQMLLPTT